MIMLNACLVGQLGADHVEGLLDGRQCGDHNQGDNKEQHDNQINGQQTFAQTGVL